MKFAVIGTGNIGKRHIQSLATLDDASLTYFDTFPASLGGVSSFLKENSLSFSSSRACLSFEEFLSSIDSQTLVIVATTADGRVELTKKILEKKPKAILLEKPVCQNWDEYQDLINVSSDTPVYVNFPRHMCSFYQDLKEKIRSSYLQIKVFQRGGGIACNGIHIFDLVIWLCVATDFSIDSLDISVPYETKRKGYFDVSGTVVFQLNKKIHFELIDSTSLSCDGISIITDDSQIHIYEHLGKMIVANDTELLCEDIVIPYQSQLTSIFASEIYAHGDTTMLPTLEQSALPHRMLFDLLKQKNIVMKFT